MSTDPIETNIGAVSNEAPPESDQQTSAIDREQSLESVPGDLINVIRGFCMGAADTVPGVSGGTVALILGHYQRLVSAISHVDRTLLGLVTQRRFLEAWRHLDGRFLLALAGGIGTGIVTLAGLMHWLLEHQLSPTYAVFFGLIGASIWIVRRYVARWSKRCWIGLGFGIAAAIGIGMLSQSSDSTSLPYLFVAGAVAICAMILPGISGAFVLLLFGVYHPITGNIKSMVKFDITVESILQMGVFSCGCLCGLLAFSKLLRWLLEHHQSLTMATLIGLMMGSVVKLWPLQRPTAETASLDSKERVMEWIPTSDWASSDASLILFATVAATLVLILDRFAGSGTQEAL